MKKEKNDDIKEVKTKKKTIKKLLTRKPKKVKEEEPTINKEKRINLKSKKEQATNFTLIEVIVIIVITGLVVSVCSGLIVYNNYDKFAKVENITKENDESDISDFIESYNHIIKSYVKDVDKGKLIDAAIEGMYNYLNDAYSIYMDQDTTETLNERLEGTYEGVGIEITMNEKKEVYISRVFTNTPAEKAGLKAGDVIISVDGESFIGKTSTDLSNTIKKGSKDTYVIGYRRDNVEAEVTVTRTKVYIDSVNSKEYDNVGYIEIETFSATTDELVKSKIEGFSSNVKSLIIDVRNDTGGYLSSAFTTSELFVDKGDVIYQLKDKNDKIEKKTSTKKPLRSFEKIVVLTNGGSASASEILAAALIENLDAIQVGETTYGKGTVQETETLSSGAMVKYTTAYWLTPKGNSIDGVGLVPKIEVSDDTKTEEDEQLTKAIEVAK